MENDYTHIMKSTFRVHTSDLRGICCREELERALLTLKNAPRDRARFCLRDLRRMAEPAGIDVAALVRDPRLLSQVPARKALTEKLLDAFHAMVMHAPSPADYMERIVRRLAPEFAADPVRTAILKKFIIGSEPDWKAIRLSAVYKWARARMPQAQQKAYGKLEPTQKAYAVVRYLNDSIFTEEALKSPSSGKWQILQVCDNLAQGRFLTNGGKTRVYLYYFAFMFGMTLRYPDEDEFDQDRDLVKNLFEDYYCDNLMRYLDAPYRKGAESAFEPEPTGEGINYKNFAEVIYLYYLGRTDLKLSPGARIDRAEEMIRQVSTRAAASAASENPAPGKEIGSEAPGEGRFGGLQEKSAADRVLPTENDFTQVYRERFHAELSHLTEEELLRVLPAEYEMPDPSAPRNRLKILTADDTRTAADQIGTLMEELDAISDEALMRCQEELTDLNRRRRAAARDKGAQLSSDEEACLEEMSEEVRCLAIGRRQWNLSDLLRKKYADEADFTGLMYRLDERIEAAYADRISENDCRLMLYLLYVLRTQTSPGEFLRLEVIVRQIGGFYGACSFSGARRAAVLLEEAGFDIEKQSDAKAKKSRYALGRHTYDDAELERLLYEAGPLFLKNEDPLLKLMRKKIENRHPSEKHITRSRLLVLVTEYYIGLLEDSPEMFSFPEIYDDFTDTINLYLEDARFQAFSEKNILDVYMLFSVYLYVIDNML